VAATDAGRAILQSFAHSEAEVLAALMSAIPEDDARLLLTAAPVLSTLADLPAPPLLDPAPDDDGSPLPQA
jgi:hypothetical protein